MKEKFTEGKLATIYDYTFSLGQGNLQPRIIVIGHIFAFVEGILQQSVLLVYTSHESLPI